MLVSIAVCVGPGIGTANKQGRPDRQAAIGRTPSTLHLKYKATSIVSQTKVAALHCTLRHLSTHHCTTVRHVVPRCTDDTTDVRMYTPRYSSVQVYVELAINDSGMTWSANVSQTGGRRMCEGLESRHRQLDVHCTSCNGIPTSSTVCATASASRFWQHRNIRSGL